MIKYFVIALFAALAALSAGAQAQTMLQAAAPESKKEVAAASVSVSRIVWQSRVSITNLTPDSNRYTCRSTAIVVWTFTIEGSKLTMENSAGAKSVAELGKDGSVNHKLITNLGNRLTLVGNALTKDLKFINGDGTCNYTVPPPNGI